MVTANKHKTKPNALVTCEIKLFQNFFSFRPCASEIILFQCVKICLKLFQRLTAVHECFPTCSYVAEIILK